MPYQQRDLPLNTFHPVDRNSPIVTSPEDNLARRLQDHLDTGPVSFNLVVAGPKGVTTLFSDFVPGRDTKPDILPPDNEELPEYAAESKGAVYGHLYIQRKPSLLAMPPDCSSGGFSRRSTDIYRMSNLRLVIPGIRFELPRKVVFTIPLGHVVGDLLLDMYRSVLP